MISAFRIAALPLAALAFASFTALLATGASAEQTKGVCGPSKVRYSVSDKVDISTAAPFYKNLPEAVITFTQGGAGPSCVIVRFSADATTTAGAVGLYVRAILDNFKEFLPNERQLVFYPTEQGTRMAEFVIANVNPGAHSARIQFRVGTSSGTGTINKPMLTLYHAP